jgi:hypothetical protein
MIDHENGTVTDERTGLMWEQHPSNMCYVWVNATAVRIMEINTAALGGHTDWRLPAVWELASLIDYTRFNSACDLLFACRSSYYWSATTSATNSDFAWYLAFNDGHVYYDFKGNSLYVRAVRAGS